MVSRTYSQMAAVFLSLAAVGAWADNDGLSKLQTVPAGERAANYLQSYLTTISTVVEAKNSGGLLGGAQTYRAVVVYNPDQQGLQVSLIGSVQDPETIQDMMAALQKIILGSNPKLEKYFGVTLADGDLSMDYLFAKTGKVLARYRNGQYSTGSAQEKSPTATPAPKAAPGT